MRSYLVSPLPNLFLVLSLFPSLKFRLDLPWVVGKYGMAVIAEQRLFHPRMRNPCQGVKAPFGH
jgi:hypothetical protein